MEVYSHSKKAWRDLNTLYGPPLNTKGFREIKNIITLAINWGPEQYHKCQR